MKLTLLRHATLVLEVGGLRLLVDPMLDLAGTRPAIEGTPSPRPKPVVELPPGAGALVRDVDAVLVTHLHADHLDDTAVRRLAPRGLPVLCQPEDLAALRERGFADVRAVGDGGERLGDVVVHRTGGRHGRGDLAERLGPVSGFVVDGTYIAGDTVWCDEVADALARHRPNVVVVNAGGARFLQGEAITMTPQDVRAVRRAAPDAVLVAVHMEAINHCVVTRDELLRAAPGVVVPLDGETLDLL
jgi:L-ascorbate metabolism protein UlaG (beta-lactamase superfamily)